MLKLVLTSAIYLKSRGMTYVSSSSTSVTEEAREEKEAEESSTEAEDLVPMVSSTEPEDRAFTGPTLPTLSRPGGVQQ